MIISDLQYLESVETSEVAEVNGGSFFFGSTRTAFARGDASIRGVGDRTSAQGVVGIVANSNAGVSEVFSNGAASARTDTFFFF